jgi:maltose O-acetyltransferase
MLSGELYDASDKELMELRINARALMLVHNQTLYDKLQRKGLLQKMLGKIGRNIDIETPFFFDHGNHIFIDDNFHAKFQLFNTRLQLCPHPKQRYVRPKRPDLCSPSSCCCSRKNKRPGTCIACFN